MRHRTQFIRYVLVGCLSLAIDVGGLYLLHGVVGIPLPVAAAASFLGAFFVNFTLSRRWTFGAHQYATSQLIRYSGLVIANTLLTSASVSGLASVGVYYVTAKLVTTVVLVVLNFFVLRLWVFPSADGPGH